MKTGTMVFVKFLHYRRLLLITNNVQFHHHIKRTMKFGIEELPEKQTVIFSGK
jgi:hypothetical protein